MLFVDEFHAYVYVFSYTYELNKNEVRLNI